MTKRIKPGSTKPATAAAKPIKKLDLLLAQLGQAGGASIEELSAATGWQKHSVRGAMAGSLKRKGHHIASSKVDGLRRYRLESAA